jgi:chemotaxis protein methyltransferase CheR
MAEDAAFESLKRTISKLLDFDCAQYSESFLKRRFETRLRATALADYASYESYLVDTKEEQERLLKELTIHITHFFRDKPVWDAVMKDLLPLLIRLRREQDAKSLTMWSAGCSTGEEPLSIAICLYELLGMQLGGFKIKILAFDRDAGTIAKACEARYTEEQLRETPAAWKERYFRCDDEGLFRPIPELLSLIEYRVADIVNIQKPKDLDILFCRNTVIYFDHSTKERLYVEFYHALKEKGFFIMGKTESLFGEARDLFQIFDNRERIFFKD